MSQVDRPGRARARRGAGPLLSLPACFAIATIASASDLVAGGAGAPAPPATSAAPDLPARRGLVPPAGTGAPAIEAHGAFETALRSRLAREARRQGLDRPLAPASPFPFDAEDDAAAEGGRRAGRAILRSLRGALDDHLENAARGSDSFAALFRFLDGRGATPPPSGDRAALMTGAPASTEAPGDAGRDTADFGVRLRIDAHPRLLVGGRVGRLEGRIEMPLLDREIRMTVEHPLGGFGGAALRGGHSADRGTWADLALTLRF